VQCAGGGDQRVSSTCAWHRGAFGRRGTVTLTPKGFGSQRGDMFVVSSDRDLDIRFVKVTYGRGRVVMLRSVEVTYVNRGARGATASIAASPARRLRGRRTPS
jgi:hypothetical protein